ncbi:MAG: peptide-methionine (S)-S-oxide reductase MsrA [Alphaproteobacteria bacterium]|jgi:methionine-S-sulfoxide reductase
MAEKEAIFAAGCFWSIEDTFRKMPGVKDAISGYTGGTTVNPTYGQVCTGATGHAEAVRVVFDDDKTDFGTLLNAFFDMHDPTQVNRQGPDIGTQYRSGVFYKDEAQRDAAQAACEAVAVRRGKVATEVTPASEFYPAEDYHQRYFEKRGFSH